MKKLILSMLAVASVALTSCSDDDATASPDTQLPPTGGIVTELSGDITTNMTLSKDVEYRLIGSLFVKPGSTLTIEPGTVVKAEAGQTNTFIAVEQGAKIMAEGTVAEPITFTSDSDTPTAGDWGGIVIAGNTQTNKGDVVQTEVAGLTYGKSAAEADPQDNSGIMNYVIIEGSGAKIDGDKEFNGLSLYTVGSGTSITNIVIKDGNDDGIEFFGGTVNVTNLLCANIADDMFDFTGGYTGTVTNAFGVREPGFDRATEDSRGIEGDSNSSASNAEPVSTPTFNNLTILNLNPDVALKSGAEIRRGSVATINNAAFIAAGGASFENLIDTNDGSGNGTLTITESVKVGNVGDNKVGGTITGTVTEEADLFDIQTLEVKSGRGADFSSFAWSGYEIPSEDVETVVELSGDITGNMTLLKGIEYTLTGSLFVKSGGTLTIEPGTIVKAEAGQTNTFIAVEQGAKIMADGTAANPITFTSDSDTPAAGDWGGIVIAGNTQTNKGDVVQTEVAGLNYGKSAAEADPQDNSGIMNYVIIEGSGAKIDGDKEFNGLSLYTVGSGTSISNIVIKNGNDDGIEFFGGTVDVTNILCANIADDMFDFTGGYTGTVTNAFGVRESGFDRATEDPRGVEGDSNSSASNAEPVSTPTFNNLTILNLNPDIALKSGAEIRRGSVATINNAAFIAAGGASFENLIDTNDGSGNGTLTITESVKVGNVGDNKVGGTITGTVTEEADLFDETTLEVKAGRGADFSSFSWSNYEIK